MKTFPYGDIKVMVGPQKGELVRVRVQDKFGATAEVWLDAVLGSYQAYVVIAREVMHGLYNALTYRRDPLADKESQVSIAWREKMKAQASKLDFHDLQEAEDIVTDIERQQDLENPELSGNDSLNLKKILMELGNELVTEHGYLPVGSGSLPENVAREIESENSTGFITTFTIWLNSHPEAQKILKDKGIEWPVVRGQR